MADDNRIEIVASLDKPKSVSTIKEDLQWVTDKLNASHALKITGNLDLPKTTQRIQSQLATINKNLSLDITGVNVNSTVMQTVSAVQNSISKAGKVSISPTVEGGQIDQLNKELDNLGVKAKNIEELTDYLKNLDVIITKIQPKFTNIAQGGSVLDSITISGIDKKTGSLVKIVDQLDEVEGKTAKITYTVTQNLAEIEKENKKVEDSAKAAQIAYNDFLKLKGEADVYAKKYSGDENLKAQIADIQKITSAFDNTQPIEKQREQIINLSNALKLLKVDIDNIKKGGTTTGGMLYPDIVKVGASGTDNSAQLERAKNDLNDFFQNIAKVEDSATRIKRAVSDTEGELTRFYVQVEKEDKSVETLTYALNEQGTAYEFLSKAIREADNSTDFRRKGLDVQKEIKTEDVNKFITQLKEANLYTGDLKTKADELKESIAKVTDTNSMNKFLDDFDIAKAKFSAMKEETRSYNNVVKETQKAIENNIKALEKFNNSSVAKNNTSNTTVTSQTGLNTNLINQLRGLQESLANDKSPENIARITARMNELDNSLRDAKFNSEALEQSLSAESAANQLSSKIRVLTNQMDIFANTNRKATESLRLMRDGETTFAAKWQQLTAAIRSGNLSAEDLKRLSNEFRVFRGEADAAGLTVSRFFQSMQSQLRMVLQRWISLYAVVGYIRKMIDNVKELDNAMINLRRVTDETDADYQRFLQDANELARQMKTTTASLVEMSYQWSKLGFEMNEALELSKASTIFMRVADVGQDQALSNLVTSLKAFRLEASQTMDVVDKLDKLNNEYAVSASGLGQGLERSASAMAMTGNSLEETLAMLTGAGEITQNLENTGNALRVISLRLQNMKGKLEDLGEPVDDLMEVSKVQTQILNLTHNQVDIIDQSTGEFRSTYQILQDIAEVWDSLNSQSRSSLLEIIAGKNRANIGSALIQAFQSGQIQSAFEDAKNAAGTATEEYSKMMQGIQAQFDAFKGAFQEFSNAFINSDLLKGLVKFGTQFIQFLTAATDKAGSLVVVLTPILTYFGGKTGTNIFSAIINGFKGLVAAETGAITATGAFTVAWKTMVGAVSGFAIGAIIAGISYVADKLIVTSAETEASIKDITSAVGDLANATEELEKSQTDIENIAQSYSKIATTVGDVNERKAQLLELQNQLSDKFKDEADGIDLVNGKYSEQIMKMKELAEEQRRQYEIENADKIARARKLASLNVTDISAVETNNGTKYTRTNWKDNERSLYTLNKMDEKVIQIAKDINGVYESASGAKGGVKGFYLSGTLEDARNQLKQIIDNYSKLRDVDSETLEKLTARYKELNDALNDIKEVTPYIEDIKFKPFFTGAFDGLADAVNQAVSDVTMQPFYDKLDEAQDKLKQLANPSDLTIAEYDTLYKDVQKLEGELYKMAGDSEDSKRAVVDLFNGFKQGISESGDHLEQFMEQFNTTLEDSFKKVAETVTGVQDAINKLAEGKGLSHSEAWKLLKEDTDGYLQSIKLVNGEYYLSQEELIKFKDAKIQASIETLKASNEEYKQEAENLKKQLETLKENLKVQLDIYNLKVMQRGASQSDLKEINKIKIDISETEDSIKRCNDLWTRNNYLIEELNQNLGDTRVLTLATETELNNTIKSFENEVNAIEKSVDELNARKDALESEKKVMEDELDILNEQKKTLEDQQKSLKKAVDDYLKRYEDSMKSQQDAIKQQKEDIKDEYDERIKALKNENEERDIAYKKEKAILDLNKAKQQQVRTYSSARGWEYGVSKEKLVEAQKNLDDALIDEQIHNLETERDELIKPLEKQEKEYDKLITAYQEYAKLYEITTEVIENADAELLAEQQLGSNWRELIEEKDEGLLNTYKQAYQNYTNKISDLTKNDIKTLEDRIKAKQAEIDKTDEQIKAYNNYKTTVQNNLSEAKTALEEYKNNATTYFGEMADAFDSMENRIWEKHNRIIQWFGEVVNAAQGLENEVGSGAVLGGIMGLRLAGFANGGTIDYTGLAMVHGSKSSSETAFSATDSKKLYDMVHNTPNLIASIVKQSGQLGGFNPSNITNRNSTNNSSINVNIGQVVANNPAELTRNLDTHLDGYFRRKLTQGYAQ